jgi:hypothetical protein
VLLPREAIARVEAEGGGDLCHEDLREKWTDEKACPSVTTCMRMRIMVVIQYAKK